jgi:glycosyltransferase involved in cell wall biosynthesis
MAVKLLIYSHFFAPSIGGVETIVLSLARGLAELRDEKGLPVFDVTLATQTPVGNHDDSSLPFRVVRGPGLANLLQLVRKSDVVHVAGPALAPLLLGRLLRKPLIIEHHGYQATCPNGLLFHHPSGAVCQGQFEAHNYLECLACNSKTEGIIGSVRLLISTFARRALSRHANSNIAPSHHVALRQSLPRTKVIFHGVDDPFVAKDILPRQTINAKGFAYLGRLVVEKGVSVLLKATHLLCVEGHEVHVALIGDGPDRPRLEKEIRSLDLERNVRITGFLSGVHLDQTLRGVGTIVIPTTMEETAGLAAMEQMMRGSLVIVSAVGGLPETVGQAGLTFPPGDATGLAAAMKAVMESPDLIVSLGKQARDRALVIFPRTRMIHNHASVYLQAAHRSDL